MSAGSASTVSGGALRRVVAGAASGALGHVINLAGQIVTVPLFLWAWGAQRYGEWLTLSAAAAYLTLLDFGMGLYVVNRLTAHYAEGDAEEYRRVLGTSFATYLSIAGGALVVGGCVLAFVSPGRLLGLTATDDWDARSVALLLLVQMAWTIPHGLLLGLYRTFGEFHIGSMIRNAQQVLALGAMAAALALGRSLVEVAAIPLMAAAVCTVFVLYDLKRRHASVPVVVGPFDLRLARRLLGPSLVFLTIQLSLALTIQGSVLLVNALYGAAAVALFVTLRTLVNTLRQIVALLNHPMWPEFIGLRARHEYAALRTAHRLLGKVCLALTASLAIFLHFAGPEIVALWTAGRMQTDQHVLDAFLILAVAQTLWLTSSSFPMAFNRHYKVAACYALSGTLGLAAGWALGRELGLVGIVLGLLLADVLVCGVTIPSDVARLLGDRPLAFWRDVALGGVLVVAVQWIVASGLNALVPSVWLRFALLGPALFGVMIGLGFRAWLSRDEQALVRGWLGGRLLASVRARNDALNSRLFDRGEFLRCYKALVGAALPQAKTVLHLGAGRGAIDETWAIFRDVTSFRGMLVALDLDGAELEKNPNPHRVHGNAETLPLASESVDVVVCEYVFEHLEHPATVVAECHRVLRTNGLLIFTTPTKWSYISLIARLTPLRFHVFISRLRGGEGEEMYRTYYRLNTTRAVRSCAARLGFTVGELTSFVGEPNYTTFLPGVHLLFIGLHKLLERLPWLEMFRISIVGVLVKA